MSPIYMIGGDKEDGKSLLTMALLEYLDYQDEQCFLVDTDVQNPDVYAYYEELPSAIVDLNALSGWAELVNICEKNSDKTIVINGATAGVQGFEKYGKILLNHLFFLKRHLITFWVISSDTEDLSRLKRYRKIVGKRIVHIVKNYKPSEGFIFPSDDFPSYDNSGIKKELRKTGRVIEMLYSQEDEICKVNFDVANFMLDNLVDRKSRYQVFTRELADEIEETLQKKDVEYFYDDFDDSSDYFGEDIGDLLAEGSISIEDLAYEAARKEDQKEELDERTRLRIEKKRRMALEPETEEEYQQRAQQEYWWGGNPEGFIPCSTDIEKRAQQEYWWGGNPEGFIPSSTDIEKRAEEQYIQDRMPKDYIPTAEQLRKKEMRDKGIIEF